MIWPPYMPMYNPVGMIVGSIFSVIIAVITLILFFLVLAGSVAGSWFIWVVLGVVVLIILGVVLKKVSAKNADSKTEQIQYEKKVQSTNIEKVDSMSGREFESFLNSLFQKQDYTVERPQYVGDYGVDFILSRGGLRIVVQAKCYGGRVEESSLRQLVQGKAKYSADEAWCVTNNFFTDAATSFANQNNIKLIDRLGLMEMIEKINIKL